MDKFKFEAMSNGLIKNCKNCPVGWSNFKTLSNEELELVEKNRFEASFKAREVIFKQGSPTSNAVFLVSGFAKIYMESKHGNNIILGIVKPGRLITGPGTYVDNIHHYTLETITECKTCFVNMETLNTISKQNSLFAEGFLKDISRKSLEIFNKLMSNSQKKMHGRLAEGLLHLSEITFESKKFNCHLSRQELGEFTFMTKESVVRILKVFNNEDIIKVDGSTFEILNYEKLKKISESG